MIGGIDIHVDMCPSLGKPQLLHKHKYMYVIPYMVQHATNTSIILVQELVVKKQKG